MWNSWKTGVATAPPPLEDLQDDPILVIDSLELQAKHSYGVMGGGEADTICGFINCKYM